MKIDADKAMTRADMRQIIVVAGLSLAMVLFTIAANLPTMIEMAQDGQMNRVVGWCCMVFAMMASGVQFIYVMVPEQDAESA